MTRSPSWRYLFQAEDSSLPEPRRSPSALLRTSKILLWVAAAVCLGVVMGRPGA